MGSENTKFIVSAEDRTQSALGSAITNVGKLSAAYASLAGVVSVGFGAGLAASFRSLVDAADNMNDLTQRIGISIRDLATFELAGAQAGVSMESLARGVKGLSTYIVENGNELRSAGITATDASSAMIQLADLFEALPDGVTKTALAVKIFGKSGMEMIPMLNQGSKGLAEAQEKARIYGERMALAAPLADKFNDQLSELALQSKSAGLNMATSLLPGLTGAVTWMNDLAAGGERAELALGFLSEKSPLFKGLVEFNKLTGRGLALAGVGGDESKRSASGKLARPLNIGEELALGEGNERVIDAIRRAEELAAKSGKKSSAARSVGSVNDYASQINQSVASAIQGSSVVKARELGDQIEKLDSLFFDSGLDLEIYTSAMDKLTGSTTKAGKETDRLGELLAATPSAALEKTRGDMQLLAKALEDKKISEDQFTEAAQSRLGLIKEAGTDTFADLTRAVEGWGNTFTDTLADVVMTGKGNFSDLANSIIRDLARIQIKKNFTDDLVKSGTGFLDKLFNGSLFSSLAAPVASQGFGMAGDAGTLLGFAGGGYTGDGARTGGLDGQGGFLAVVHPQESVIDHTTAIGGGSSPVIVNIIEDKSRGGQTQSRSEGGQNMLDVFVAQIRSVVAGDIASGRGPIPAAMESTYGANRAAGAF